SELIELSVSFIYINFKEQLNDYKSSLMIKQNKSNQLKAFMKLYNENTSWDLKTVGNFLSEVRESNLILLPLEKSRKNKSIIELSETINYINSNFEEISTMLLESILTTKFGFTNARVKSLINNKDKLTNFLQSTTGSLSKPTIWFLMQMIMFPDFAKQMLKESLSKIYELFSESGLKKECAESLREKFDALSSKRSEEIVSCIVEKNNFSLDNNLPLHMVIQHSLPYFGMPLIKDKRKQMFVVGDTFEEIEKILPGFSGHIVKTTLKILADPTRFTLIQVLAEDDRYVDELAEMCNVSKSTISHHLSVLAEYELVDKIRENKKVYYSLKKERLERFLNVFDKMFVKGSDNV
ncbi:MAG: metalloregulator ArsR/SmtB family transcription factor, partial [Elusimicrobiota bacterium]